MSKPLKILIVRFSSIGDIILTSPVIRNLKNQLDCEIHFLTKYKYHELLQNNPYLDNIFYLQKSILETIRDLKKEEFDYVIDLHNNLRSFFLFFLGPNIKKYNKSNFKKYLYINFGINLLKNEHVVDRYMNSVVSLGIENDHKGLDYFIGANTSVNFDTKQKYLAWSIGGSHIQKQLSVIQISKVCSQLKLPIILLGGEQEKENGEEIKKLVCNDSVINLCGQLTIDESAYIIHDSFLLLTNDTGLMHIGAALKKTIISFWGCTKPDLGFSPYLSNDNSLQIISDRSQRQCSKHGNSCKFSDDGCVKLIDSDEIYQTLRKYLD